jgi:hypothetical protein
LQYLHGGSKPMVDFSSSITISTWGLKKHIGFFLLFHNICINGHINIYVLHIFKYFNMVDANITFLNGDSFKGFQLIDKFFSKPYVQVLHFLKKIIDFKF